MLFSKGIRKQVLSDKILAVFLIASALFIFPWMVGFAGWYNNQPYRDILFYIPFVNGLTLGPLLFFYTKSYTNLNLKLRIKDYIHFIPAALYLLLNIVIVVNDKLIVKKYSLMNGESDPDFDNWYQWLIKISIVSYAYFTYTYYKQYKAYLQYESSFIEKMNTKWLRNFIAATILISILPVMNDLLKDIGIYKGINDYIADWYFFISYALVVYFIAIKGYHNSIEPKNNVYFEPQLLLQFSEPLQLSNSKNQVEDITYELVPNNDTNVQIESWKTKIDDLMQLEKLYENENLTLTLLSKKLSSNPSVISKVINQGYQLNFNDFINQYRVKAVQEKMRNGEHLHQTLLSLAFDCGFNSKATFNRAFKKVANSSPKEWAEQLKS